MSAANGKSLTPAPPGRSFRLELCDRPYPGQAPAELRLQGLVEYVRRVYSFEVRGLVELVEPPAGTDPHP